MKDETYLKIAHTIANESKCVSRKVGAVIVKDDHIVGHGYNGTPSKQKNCCDVNASLIDSDGKFINQPAADEHHDWSIYNELHAEHNAIIYSNPVDRQGAILYCTLQPCYICSLLIAGSGIKKVVFSEHYHRTPPEAIAVLKNAGVEVVHVEQK